MPPGNRLIDGTQDPTVSHQSSPSTLYQPASIQKYSAPTSAAAFTNGRSRSVVGLPIRVFM
jgi:hypothetical protein